jgi:DNA-binding CsgD family transcriptional regulator
MVDLRRMEKDVARLTAADLDHIELRRGVVDRVAAVVPVDASCASVADPTSLVLTSVLGDNVDRSFSPLVYRNEYAQRDVGQHSVLARSQSPVRVLSRAAGGDPSRSPRFREVLEPMGVRHELRAAMRDRGGATWGFFHLYRVAGRRDFTADEADFVERVGRLLAPALRRATIAHGAGAPPAPAVPPGVLIFGEDGAPAETTPGAERWMELLRDPAFSDQTVPEAVMGLIEWARAIDHDGSDERASAIVPAADGTRAAVSASATDHGRIAVVVQQASAAQLQPVLLAGLGLTPGERDLAALVLQGRSTKECAEELSLSPHTVQDRMKSIFAKAGVRSRRDLVAQLSGAR